MVQDSQRRHRQPLQGCACLGHKGGSFENDTGATLLTVKNAFTTDDEPDNFFNILIGLRGQTNHEVELDLFYPHLSDPIYRFQDIVFGDALFNKPAQARGTSLRGKGNSLCFPLSQFSQHYAGKRSHPKRA